MSHPKMNPRLAFGATLLAATAAWADGAFPDSLQVLLPTDRSGELLLTTNFGVVVSQDDGGTWSWICEEAIGALVSQYQLGPTNRLYAVSPSAGLTVSADHGCSWASASDPLTGMRALDVFADPSDAAHVLALVDVLPDGGDEHSALVESHDGALTFGPELYRPAPGGLLTGVEIARSAPGTWYLSELDPGPTGAPHAVLIHATDAGTAFERFDESAVTGPDMLRIAAVDPFDPRTLYLRLLDPTGADALVISHDSGATLAIAARFQHPMSAFLKASDGSLWAGSKEGELVHSPDGGAFVPVSGAPHLRGLTERDGVLYAAADQLQDGYALAISSDQGAHWTALLRYPQLRGPLACGALATTCATPWKNLQAKLHPQSPDAGPSPKPGSSCDSCQATGGSFGLLALTLLLRLSAPCRSPSRSGRRRTPPRCRR